MLRTTFQMKVGRAFESHVYKTKRESKRMVSPVWTEFHLMISFSDAGPSVMSSKSLLCQIKFI